jgi:hypothetical protein
MQKNDAHEVLEGEIVDDTQEGSPRLPSPTAPAAGAVRDGMEQTSAKKSQAGGWIEVIAAIGGAIVKWLTSPSQTHPPDGGERPGQRGGGARMRRRRGGRG